MTDELLLPSASDLINRISAVDFTELAEFMFIAAADHSLQRTALGLTRFFSDVRPEDTRVLLLRAYLVWELMEFGDFDLEVLSMQSLLDSHREVGAAGLMLDRLIRRARWMIDPDFRAPVPDVISALRQSVKAEPHWVDNHLALSKALKEANDPDGAEYHQQRAVANCRGRDAATEMDYAERAWSICFTGVLTDPASTAYWSD